MERFALAFAFVAALGSGVMAGFFYAFSGLVMPSFARRPAAHAVGAMQTINVVAPNPLFFALFFALFFGTAMVGAACAALAPFTLSASSAGLALASTAVYVAGSIGVTMARNVPMNEDLAAPRPRELRSRGALATPPARLDMVEPRPRLGVPRLLGRLHAGPGVRRRGGR